MVTFGPVVLISTAAFADILPLAKKYELLPCGQANEVPCSVIKTVRAPTADDLKGLNNHVFQQWFASHGIGGEEGSTFTYDWFAFDSNVNGYVIGVVDSEGGDIHTQFVFHKGNLSCCVTDTPFFLADINDNNLMVGSNIYQPIAEFVGVAGKLNADKFPAFLDIANPDGFPPYFSDLFGAFLAIDDQDRMLGSAFGEYFMALPLPESTVPEPATALMLGTALVLAAVFAARRGRLTGTRHS